MSIGATNIAFVGYPVSDMDRSRKFYGEVLGLKCIFDESIEAGQSWVEYEIGNETLAISNAWPPSGQSGPSVAIEVQDLDAALEHLRNQGVQVTMDTIESPVCHMAAIADPDGNSIVLHKLKNSSPNA